MNIPSNETRLVLDPFMLLSHTGSISFNIRAKGLAIILGVLRGGIERLKQIQSFANRQFIAGLVADTSLPLAELLRFSVFDTIR